MQIYRTLDKGKTMHPGDEEEQEANEMKPDSKLKEKKVRPLLWYPRLKTLVADFESQILMAEFGFRILEASGRFWSLEASGRFRILDTGGRFWIMDASVQF